MQKQLPNRTVIVPQGAQKSAQGAQQGTGYLANAHQFFVCPQSPPFYNYCSMCNGATYILCPNCPPNSDGYIACPSCQAAPHIQYQSGAQ